MLRALVRVRFLLHGGHEGAFPGGNYNGTFRDDYELTNTGDLDICNGMTVNGQYRLLYAKRLLLGDELLKGHPPMTVSENKGPQAPSPRPNQ